MTSLYVETDEPALSLRREKLSLQCATRHAANPSNHAFEATFQPHFRELYENKPNPIKFFGIRIAPLLVASNINSKMIKNILLWVSHHGV